MTAAAVALLVTGCSGDGGAKAGADCMWYLNYGGRSYVAPKDTGPVVEGLHHQGTPLGQGSFPGCDDGGGPEQPEKVRVYRIPGVDPAAAVITQNDQVGVSDPDNLPASVRALLKPQGSPASP